LLALLAGVCQAQEAPSSVLQDIKLYFTSPLRWDENDWLTFGGVIATTAISHHYDSDVRTHFLKNNPGLATDTNSYDLQDAVPAVAALVGTWVFATLAKDNDGRHESKVMAEAAALSVSTAFMLKFATGRERPNETSDPNSWRAGSDSFPSVHVTAAVAIGTVLAESGNDDYRWARRVLGYGIGAFTGYERLKHNDHWLSDSVAGAALGWASARFVLDQDAPVRRNAQLQVIPIDGGAMVSISYNLH
jgi:hypothetical protein